MTPRSPDSSGLHTCPRPRPSGIGWRAVLLGRVAGRAWCCVLVGERELEFLGPSPASAAWSAAVPFSVAPTKSRRGLSFRVSVRVDGSGVVALHGGPRPIRLSPHTEVFSPHTEVFDHGHELRSREHQPPPRATSASTTDAHHAALGRRLPLVWSSSRTGHYRALEQAHRHTLPRRQGLLGTRRSTAPITRPPALPGSVDSTNSSTSTNRASSTIIDARNELVSTIVLAPRNRCPSHPTPGTSTLATSPRGTYALRLPLRSRRDCRHAANVPAPFVQHPSPSANAPQPSALPASPTSPNPTPTTLHHASPTEPDGQRENCRAIGERFAQRTIHAPRARRRARAGGLADALVSPGGRSKRALGAADERRHALPTLGKKIREVTLCAP